MADGSKRELIITNIETALKALTGIKTVKREHPSVKELQSFAATQFPFVGIIGSLPKPVTENHHGGGVPGRIKAIKSELYVRLYFVASVNGDYDKKISYYADMLWAKIYEDQTRGGYNWVLSTTVDPETSIAIEPPYIAFYMDVKVVYIHDTSGI